MSRAELPPLHLLTDDEVCARAGFAAAAGALLRAAGTDAIFHLRAPHATGRWCYEAALRLRDAAHRAGALLVVNDRLDVALAAGADGVQLAERSLGVADARALSPPGFRIGASVHAADRAIPSADWLMAGNVYPTASHPGRPAAGSVLVRRLAERGARVVAVGGITAERVAELRSAGAAGIAVIHGVWDAPDPAGAVSRYLEAWYA